MIYIRFPSNLYADLVIVFQESSCFFQPGCNPSTTSPSFF